MPYENKTPGNAPIVVVEWLDITSDKDIARRWSVGWLLSSTYISENRTCLRTAMTWDEDGWDELSTYKLSDVAYIHYVEEE
jgi:hypothetical protein